MTAMQVDPNILQVALAKAITDAVPPEMQKEIFARALHDHLFHASRNSDKSPISDSFQRALNDATRALANEIVNEPENKAKVKATIQKAFDQSLESGNLLQKICDKFTGSFGW